VGGHWAGGGGGADADGSAQPKTRTPHKDAGKKENMQQKNVQTNFMWIHSID
jgi:hypothetical protein